MEVTDVGEGGLNHADAGGYLQFVSKSPSQPFLIREGVLSPYLYPCPVKFIPKILVYEH